MTPQKTGGSGRQKNQQVKRCQKSWFKLHQKDYHGIKIFQQIPFMLHNSFQSCNSGEIQKYSELLYFCFVVKIRLLCERSSVANCSHQLSPMFWVITKYFNLTANWNNFQSNGLRMWSPVLSPSKMKIQRLYRRLADNYNIQP